MPSYFFFLIPTKVVGGVGCLNPILRHRWSVFSFWFTYSDFGGWNWITQSSSSQNISLIRHISSQVGDYIMCEQFFMNCFNISFLQNDIFKLPDNMGNWMIGMLLSSFHFTHLGLDFLLIVLIVSDDHFNNLIIILKFYPHIFIQCQFLMKKSDIIHLTNQQNVCIF